MKQLTLIATLILNGLCLIAQTANGFFIPTNNLFANKNKVKPTNIVENRWDVSLNNWQSYSSVALVYNSTGLIEKSIATYEKYNKSYANEYNYYGNGRIKSQLTTMFNEVTNLWDTSAYLENSIDEKGNYNLVTGLFINHVPNKIINKQKTAYSYTYDADNKVEEMIEESFNYNKNLFEYYRKVNFSYSDEGKPIGVVYYYFNKVTNLFEPTEKLSNIEWHVWNGTVVDYWFQESNALMKSAYKEVFKNGNWIIVERKLHTYDDKDNIISFLVERNLGNAYDTSVYSLYVNKYDSDENLVDILLQRRIDGSMVNFSSTTFGSFKTVGLPQDYNLDIYPIMIYPNPATDKVTFKINNAVVANLVLFDKTGKQIQNLTIENGICSVHKANFSNGVYFYILSINNQPVKTGKIIFH